MTDNVYVAEFSERYLESATEVLVKSFLSLNDIWKKYNYTYKDVYPLMRAKLIPSLAAKWSYVSSS